MTHIINKTIILKEISEDEFRQKTNWQEQVSTIENLVNLVEKQNDADTCQKKTLTVENILFGLKRQTRAFGLYDGELYIGYVALAECESPTPEIQIELAESHRHRGIGYRALRLVIDEAFQIGNVDFLIYRAHFENIASIALAEKCGGVLVKSNSLIDQIIHKYHIYAPKEDTSI